MKTAINGRSPRTAPSRHGMATNTENEPREQIRGQILECLDTILIVFTTPQMKTESRAVAMDLRRELRQLGTPAKLTSEERELAELVSGLLKCLERSPNAAISKAARKLDRRFVDVSGRANL